MATKIKLHFVGTKSPALDQVVFQPPSAKEPLLSVRGKTSGAYETDRTFQWTNAVQGVAILFLRAALYNWRQHDGSVPPTRPFLEGGKGSIVASLDYALDKQPAWLFDMFGSAAGGKAFFRSMLDRSNPGLRRDGTTRIGLRTSDFSQDGIQIYWNSDTACDQQTVFRLLRLLEKATGTMSAEEVVQQQQDDTEPVSATPAQPESYPAPASRIRPSPNAAVFKTPFILQGIRGGEAYVRCYERDHQAALLVSFVPAAQINRQRRIPLRIHSSCNPSEALGSTDCDCKSQLDSSIRYLRENQGLLIYMQQEGRGAGLFSKYQGMHISAQSGLDTYAAYKKMGLSSDLRSYELASTILQDLGVTKVSLLSNNPEKRKELEKLGFDVASQSCFGAITPQNLSYVHAKMSLGNHELKELFIARSNEPYLVASENVPSHMKHAWIFGGDDTLWEDNIIYEDIIRIFIDHICRYVALPRDEIRSILDSTERAVIPEHGFGAPGFLVSLSKTLELIATRATTEIPKPAELFDSVLPRLSSIAADIPPRTREVLRELRSRGDGLVLFVQGPQEFQLRKVAASGLSEHFHAVSIVRQKDTKTLQELVSKLPFQADFYTVVGNNLETDMAPAAALGFRAVHYNNPNSWELLNRSEYQGANYREISLLEEVLTL